MITDYELVVPELVPHDELTPAVYNPRKADEERLLLVELSLSRFGWLLPIFATDAGEILSGHQRHLVAGRLGFTRVPVVRVPEADLEKRMQVNVAFNRATNDLRYEDHTSEMRDDLVEKIEMVERVKALPEIEPDSAESFPCLTPQRRAVAEFEDRWFEAGGVGAVKVLVKGGIPLQPIIVGDDGTVINGSPRLEYARRYGTEVDVVTVPSAMADEVSLLLNRLSMDFDMKGRYADAMRYSNFRRKRLNQLTLNRGFSWHVLRGKNRTVPTGRTTENIQIRMHRDGTYEADQRHVDAWRRYYGDTVLDFGAGTFNQTKILRQMGVHCSAFEPFVTLEDTDTLDVERAREMARPFLDDVANGVEWDTIFLSSVMNSVPFYEDRVHIVRLVSALASPKTAVDAVAFSKRSEAGRSAFTTAGGMKVSYSNKTQKAHSLREWQQLWMIGFGVVDVGPWGSLACGRATRPQPVDGQLLADAIAFEFDLPYPDDLRLGLVDDARAAFEARLGIELPPATVLDEETPGQASETHEDEVS